MLYGINLKFAAQNSPKSVFREYKSLPNDGQFHFFQYQRSHSFAYTTALLAVSGVLSLMVLR